MVGHICLVNYAITYMSVLSFMVYKWLLGFLSFLNKALKNFLWTSSILNHKIVIVAWDTCCLPLNSKDRALKG